MKSNKSKRKLPSGVASSRHLYWTYSRTAKNRNLEFKLSYEEAFELWNKPCFYCGSEPNQTYKHNSTSNGGFIYNGIDRVNNSIGYEKENCVSCCKICNYAKHDHDLEEFKEWLQRAYHHMFEQELVQVW